MAELTDDEKDRISHRGRAFRALRELLEASSDPGQLPHSR
jgi:inosine/xanthosine triphosphate pyrophosphatase family protein